MAVLTKSGRTALAVSLKAQPIHLALGLGDGEWTVAPEENIQASGTVANAAKLRS
jgi:hypothetical protein